VAKALASCENPTPAAASATAKGRGRSTFAANNSAKLQQVWAEGIPTPGRGRGEGSKHGENSKKQSGPQTPVMGQASGAGSPASKKTKD